MPWTGDPVPAADVPDPDELATAWLVAVLGTSYVALRRVDAQRLLTDLADDMIAVVTAERLDRSLAHRVGHALVTAHFTNTQTLEATLGLLHRELGRAATTEGHTARVAAASAALAAGFADALQVSTRAEQERIGVAAFAARAAAEQARWNSEARFKAVFDAAHVGIGVVDTEGYFLEANRTLCELFGYSLDELVQLRAYTFGHPEDSPDVWPQVRAVLGGEADHLRVTKPVLRKDGVTIMIDGVLSLVRDADGVPRFAITIVEDVTDRHQLEARLRHQAHHDPLTGLTNRATFFERLDAALGARAGEIGVACLGLDGFKAVNDALGHDVGDELLKVVASRLATRLEGHLVARMGGDEFAVLVEHPGHQASVTAELASCSRAALRAIRRPIRLGDHKLAISASAGVVERAEVTGGAAELMKAADITLHAAKQAGGDRVAAFDTDRHDQEVGRLAMITRMPEALARGEFMVDYQPLVRLSDQRLVGVEALVRWHLPTGERIRPDRFIPLAEETGLIVPLGRKVLAESCRMATEWRATGAELFVSVNVAARQVREPGAVADIAAILAETGLPPAALQLELTESDLMDTGDESSDALTELAEMGVKIAIDDFGTGYSNLAYLQHLPVHALKLAGRFVVGIGKPGSDGVDTEIVMLLIRLAHVLGLQVTAESVETAAQMAELRELGCDIGQGWFFAPAVDAGSIADMLRGEGT